MEAMVHVALSPGPGPTIVHLWLLPPCWKQTYTYLPLGARTISLLGNILIVEDSLFILGTSVSVHTATQVEQDALRVLETSYPEMQQIQSNLLYTEQPLLALSF